MLITTIWATRDVEGDLRKRQATWLIDAERRCVERLAMSKLLKLDGVSSDDDEPPVQKQPTTLRTFNLP